MAVDVGSVLNGRYRLDQQIGQGGFARVYLGTDLLLERRIAIKVLDPQLGDATEAHDFLARFASEARVIAALDHPNILGVHDYGQSDGTAYLVMPYIAGGTLHDLARERGRLPVAVASGYLTQVAAALDYAHARNLVHRDIKPQNMLLRDNGAHLLLADFGIAKVLSGTTGASNRTGVLGTVIYMAPEQLEGQVSRATDIYALGCVLFQLLTGTPPYTGETGQVVRGHLLAPVPTLTERGLAPAPALQAIVDRALAKRPEERYERASDLTTALAVATDSSSAPPSTVRTPTLSAPTVPAPTVGVTGGALPPTPPSSTTPPAAAPNVVDRHTKTTAPTSLGGAGTPMVPPVHPAPASGTASLPQAPPKSHRTRNLTLFGCVTANIAALALLTFLAVVLVGRAREALSPLIAPTVAVLAPGGGSTPLAGATTVTTVTTATRGTTGGAATRPAAGPTTAAGNTGGGISIAASGAPVPVTIATPGQDALLAFDAQAGDRVSLKVSGSTVAVTNVTLLQPDGTALRTTLRASPNGFLDTQALPAAGRYTIHVDPEGTAVGRLSVTLYGVPADVATPIVPGGPPVTVTLETPGQNARLPFDCVAGQRVSLRVTSSTIGVSYLAVLRPDGEPLKTNLRAAPDGFLDTQTVPAAGMCTILVDPEAAATGTLTVTAYNVPPDAAGTIAPGGPAVSLETGTPGQDGRLTFEGRAGQRVSAKVSASTIAVSYLSVIKPDGEPLKDTLRAAPNGFLDALALPVSGAYTLLVDPEGIATGRLTVTLYGDIVDVTGAIAAGGAAMPVTITLPGQNARLTFDARSGDRASVRVTNGTIDVAYVSLLKPDGEALKTNLRAAPNGFLDTIALPVTGTYTLLIDPEGTATGMLNVTLYTVPPDASGTIVVGGAPVTVTIATPGQNGRLTFDGGAGQRVIVKVTAVANSVGVSYVTLLRPDGEALKPNLRAAPDGTLDPLTLPVAGVYTVLIDPEEQATGTVTVSLVAAP